MQYTIAPGIPAGHISATAVNPWSDMHRGQAQTDRQADRRTDMQAGRQADRQTSRQPE